MSYNNDKNTNKNIELDDMKIKSHLNNSLDLEGISVSEELINRTLAAIKEQQALIGERGIQTGKEKPGTKIILWNRYVRSFAGVAAALLLVVVGYNVIKQMPIVKNETTSMDNAAPEANLLMDQSASTGAQTDMAAQEAPAAAGIAEDAATTEGTGQAAPEADTQYTISAETFADEATADKSAKVGSADNAGGPAGTEAETQITSMPEDNAKTREFSTALRSTNDTGASYTFRDIFLPNPENAEYITISNNKNDASVTLTALEDIQAFYLVMDAHQFTGSTQDTTADQSYTVEMKTPDTQALYTMYLGSKLVVKFTQGDTVSENVYDPDDNARLKQDIETFLQEYTE